MTLTDGPQLTARRKYTIWTALDMCAVGRFIELLGSRFHTNRTLHAEDLRCYLLALRKVVVLGTPCPEADLGSASLVVWK